MPLTNFGFVKVDVNSHSLSGPFISRSAQPDKRGFDDLSDIGVNKIFKLCNNDEFCDLDEKNLFPYGDVYNFPLPELFRGGCLNDVIKIAQTINGMYQLKNNIHIHCSHGRDRTGLVTAAWQLMYDNKSIKEVDAERPIFGCNALIDIVDSPDRHILTEIYLLKCHGKL